MNINKSLAAFKKQGFCLFGQLLTELERINIIESIDKILVNSEFAEDLLSIGDSGKTHKILFPLAKNKRLLQYIVHPTILDILIQLMPDPTQIVLTWEDILIKEPRHGIPVTYHQDLALQSVKHDIFSFGIYLHDADKNPVYYLPESFHYGPLTKTKLYEVAEANKNNFVPLKAKAGDLSLHYVKTIHYSDINYSPYPRYTWYLEYRTIEQLLNDSPWDEDWIMKRRAIFVSALCEYAPPEYIEKLAPDVKLLKPYLDDLQLRVPQTNSKVQYDMESPYNHFA